MRSIALGEFGFYEMSKHELGELRHKLMKARRNKIRKLEALNSETENQNKRCSVSEV